MLLVTTLWAWPVRHHCLLILLTLQQLLYENVRGYSVESLTEVQEENIHFSPLVHQARHFIVESYEVGNAWCPLMNWCWLAMTSAVSISFNGCIPSWAPGLCVSSLLKYYSLTLSSSTKAMCSLLQNYPMVSRRDFWSPLLLVKTEEKEAFSTSHFSVLCVTSIPIPVSSRCMLSLVFLLMLICL